MLWLSKFGSVDAIAGQGYEFQVIAAVVVGGVAIFGGSGTVVGAALGALLLNSIDSALVVVKVSSNWNLALAGALLLAAIAFDRLISIRVAPALSTRRRAVADLDDLKPGDEVPRRPRGRARCLARWEMLLALLAATISTAPCLPVLSGSLEPSSTSG